MELQTKQVKIIYEDENLAAVNKPYGKIFDWALDVFPTFIPVHRLDKDTSGVILFAKDQKTADYLKTQFQLRKIEKTYMAMVVGSVTNNSGLIDLPIGRSKKTPLKRVALRHGVGQARGKIREAITEYKIIKKCGDFTFLEAHPKTGRTHQIRSHLAAIGHPILCDKLYAGKKFICPAGLTRQFLHASAVELTLPPGSRLRLEADLPEDLENVKFFLCHH